ncbi:ATP-binding protein [Paraburkholderia sp. BCC1884]|uniref:ATP-binding protein n=1 Tax=Paraburkholderia sp. BCC1884 TaxID=2562668 RepID=UPI00118367EC|nr:winged helix-turn-helix domain-containing protein [Paraburkholderia sp. BCC1884]
MIELGRFQIDLEMRTLQRDGEPVHVGSRAFDILAVVVSAGGRLVTKDELMNAVWPQTIVEENNIQVHLSALRKILGADRNLILTVPGRGYQLVTRQPKTTPERADTTQPATLRRPLPSPKTQLVGRDATVRQIRALLKHSRVLTLVGAGGIGKTSLAIETARQASADYPEPACFVELATLISAAGVLGAIAQSCGLAVETPCAEQIAAAFAPVPTLLVLDNAEHVADHVAEIVEVLVARTHSLRVLVTSREPLRIMAETLLRVDPLNVPAPYSSDAEILQQSAVNLFLLRSHSLQREVAADSAELQLVGEICRRLDGLPLAIELAAARVATLGVEGVHRRLDDRMAILAGGYRTALPRHQTLRATFDWSYALLDPGARSLFRRIGVFGGVFTFEAMCAVVCDPLLTVASAINGISELLAKSLVNIEFDGPVAKYRLTESTRAYALDKLQAEGERRELAARHARFLSTCFQTRLTQLVDGRTRVAALDHTLDDARDACDWAFSADGNPRLGIELASNLTSALFDEGLFAECCTRAAQAVEVLDRLPDAAVDPGTEMRVRAALASALPYVHGSISKAANLWQTVFAMALTCGDVDFHARALWGQWHTMISLGAIHESMTYAQRFQQLARDQANPWHTVFADQLVAISQHCLGRHVEARRALLDARERFAQLEHTAPNGGKLAVNPLVYCNGTLARIAWLQGKPEEARQVVDDLMARVQPDVLEPSLTHMLGTVAAPLALMSGDLGRAATYLEIMRSQAALHHLDVWRDYCDCLSAYRDLLSGQTERALPRLKAALDSLRSRGFRRLITPYIVGYADGLSATGRTEEAGALLEQTLAVCERNGEMFFVPEIWRAMGVAAHAEVNQRANPGESCEESLTRASTCFARAVELSRAQGALMWELRASMANARHLCDQGRADEALDLLERLALHFDTPAGTADIRALFEMIDALRSRQGQHLSARKWKSLLDPLAM